MSFWDKTFKVAKTVGSFAVDATTNVATHMAEEANKTREIHQKFSDMGDDELLKIVHSEGFFGKSSKEKAVAFTVLRKRGFTVEEINAAK